MRARSALSSFLPALGAAILLCGCGCGDPPVAEIVEVTGTTERNAAGGSAWDAAGVGQTFHLGDAVRTAAASTARLRVGERGGVAMQPETMLRFLSERTNGAAGVQVEAGEVELDGIDLQTARGRLRLAEGSRVRVLSDGTVEGVQRVEVIAGQVIFEEEGGGARTIAVGTAIEIAVGAVVFEDEEGIGAAPDTGTTPEAAAAAAAAAAAEAAAAEAAAAEAAAAEAAAAEGEGEEGERAGEEAAAVVDDANVVVETSPERAHLTITAGESPTIHDPGEPPTAVRIDFAAACPGRALLTLTAGRSRPTRWRGEGSVIVAARAGRSRYTIACQGEGRNPPSGAITIRRDDGSQRLDPVAPRNMVDADGRSYDVLYQNALPILTVRWRDARGVGAPILHVNSPSRGERTFPAPGGRAELHSGELGEGSHRVWVTQGPQRSPETTVRIRFDNAAPAATVREPSGRAPISPGTVRVSGIVLEGFSVRASGVELPIDDHLRFGGEVPVPEGVDALAVRFSHPRRGVHYYLRRVAR